MTSIPQPASLPSARDRMSVKPSCSRASLQSSVRAPTTRADTRYVGPSPFCESCAKTSGESVSRRDFPALNPGFTYFRRGLDSINKTIWPTVFGLDRLRVAVREVRNESPQAGNAEIIELVAGGATVPIQTDLTRFEDDFTTEEQQALIGQLALFGLTSHLEGALESACAATGLSHKSLMFAPDEDAWNDSSRWAELDSTWAALRQGGSALIEANYLARYSRSPHFSVMRIPALETGFRYWKEARNALIHAGGSASSRFIEAQTAYSMVKRADLGVRSKAMLSVDGHVLGSPRPSGLLKLGDPIVISPYAAFNAADIMLKLAYTLDFLIARTPRGEAALLQRLDGEVNPKRWHDPQYRSTRTVGRLIKAVNAPTPADPQSILDAISSRRA